MCNGNDIVCNGNDRVCNGNDRVLVAQHSMSLRTMLVCQCSMS